MVAKPSLVASRITLAAALAFAPVLPALAVEAPVAVPADASLDEARERIKTGDYDGAISLLKDKLAIAGAATEVRREAYLLLIKTHVFQGNDFKFKPQGVTASELSYAEARRLTVEFLSREEFRHARPEPETEYPPEMVRLFDDVRREIFGGVRVRGVTPADATVLFDGDTLQALPGEGALGAVDVPVGLHLLQVFHDGYETVTDRVAITPNSTLERSYTLTKRRGTGWYATRVGVGLAVVGGLVIALASGGSTSSDDTPQPLPGPPPPPGARGR